MKKLSKKDLHDILMLRQDLQNVEIRCQNIRKILDKKGWRENETLLDVVEYDVKVFGKELLEIERKNEEL